MKLLVNVMSEELHGLKGRKIEQRAANRDGARLASD